MLAPYRDVLSVPGAKQWTAAGFTARLPIAMVTLAIVLLVTGTGGSYGLAGTVSAAYVVATAATSPLLARLMDSWGQARVLIPAVLVFAAGLAGLTLSIEREWAAPVPHALAAVAGAAYPPVGACVRARWAHALGDGARLQTAYALEAVVDESIFIVGPVAVTLLATDVDRRLGVVLVVVAAVSGGCWLAALRGTEPPGRGRHGRTSVPIGARWLAMLVAAAACLGSLFGSTEVITVAFAQEQGSRAAAGPLLACWAAGSLIAGVVTGSVRWRTSVLVRYRAGAVAMAAVMVPLPFVTTLALMAPVLFVAGFAISPTLVALVSLVQAQVPAVRLTEGITWVTTGIALGVAPGAAVAGWLIDEYGASPAYGMAVVGGLLAAVVAALTPSGPHPPSRSQPLPRQPAGGDLADLPRTAS